MQNITILSILLVIALSLTIAVGMGKRWLVRKRARDNRYGVSIGTHSIGFHFGKWSAYAFPSNASHACPSTGKGYKRTINRKFLKVV